MTLTRRLLTRMTLLGMIVVGLVAGTSTHASAASATSVSAHPSATKVTAGTRVTMSGTVSGAPGRPVQLQLSTGTGWATVASTTTAADGSYTMVVPTWWLNSNVVRVTAPATAVDAAGTSGVAVVTVIPGYTPKGVATSNSTFGPRWNPCEPIVYKVNTAGGYSGSLSDIQSSFARMGRNTGLKFVYGGTTASVPFVTGSDPSADITVGFATPSQVSNLAGSVVGLTSSSYYAAYGREKEYVASRIVFDRTASLRRGFHASGAVDWGQVMTHEIGHAVGLEHTSSSSQLMNPTVTSLNHRAGRGDLAGLNNRGAAAGCIANSMRNSKVSTQRIASAVNTVSDPVRVAGAQPDVSAAQARSAAASAVVVEALESLASL